MFIHLLISENTETIEERERQERDNKTNNKNPNLNNPTYSIKKIEKRIQKISCSVSSLVRSRICTEWAFQVWSRITAEWNGDLGHIIDSSYMGWPCGEWSALGCRQPWLFACLCYWSQGRWGDALVPPPAKAFFLLILPVPGQGSASSLLLLVLRLAFGGLQSTLT